ncbi:DUF3078 domain-containing protein [Echinicola jeungdonensis]|uniref:DUF3078 domain-containing protein n=1 Tax=Echinicola jeungdonensis TaxID=709343 RepID=A0ABV5J0C7_9BACT|nr:DUF3078 domain-containing protein [Echinicola jeungdonensis]MDN3671113.1 DUF3078 domain-containing protein [Echinicola jeungdonensis]
MLFYQKKILSIIFIFQCVILQSFAQDTEADSILAPSKKDTTYWVNNFKAGLNFNQAAFSSNWKSGGVNSVALGSVIAGKANYAKGKWSWDNEIELLYGVVKNEGQTVRKSNDRIFLDSKVGYKISKNWGSYFSGNFLSQFTKGYNYDEDGNRTLISGWMSPGFLTASLGFEYKPNQEFNLRIGPLSPRFTFVTDGTIADNVPENYGVTPGETVRAEWFAFQLFATWDKDFNENFNLKSRYQMFANYETLAFDSIDHRLDITLTAKISKLINVTFTNINLYDIDQDSGIQYSQGLSLGILYKVNNKK